MGRYVFKLPDVGEGTTEAEIVAWHVKVGDTVEEDDPLVEVMTDKATVELPAPVSGRIVAIHGAVGDKRPVGSDLVVLEVETEVPEQDRSAPQPAPDPPSVAPVSGSAREKTGSPARPSREQVERTSTAQEGEWQQSLLA